MKRTLKWTLCIAMIALIAMSTVIIGSAAYSQLDGLYVNLAAGESFEIELCPEVDGLYTFYSTGEVDTVASVYDNEGNLIITATSQWILIDFVRKRPMALKDNLPEFTVINEHSMVSDFEKLRAPSRIDYQRTFSIRFDDIDINMHVNNSLYPLWASETLSNVFRDEYLPSEIEISFKKEGHLGEDVQVTTEQNAEKTIHSIISLNDNRELSNVRIKWIKK